MQKAVFAAGAEFSGIQTHPKWKQEIRPALEKLSKGKTQRVEIIEMLKTFHGRYCWRRFEHFGKKKGAEYNFKVLFNEAGEDLPNLVGGIATFVLKYKPDPIPYVLSGRQASYDYTHPQLFYVFSLMFLCLTPKQFSDKTAKENTFSSSNNLSHVLSRSPFKTKCIIEYIKEYIEPMLNEKVNEKYTIYRRVVKEPVYALLDEKKNLVMNKITIQKDTTSIEQFVGDFKTDFANRYLGGGVLRTGCVQQEIMFALRPEILVATLLCQKMESHEAIGLAGFKKHFANKGYAENTTYDGKQAIKYEIDEKGRIKEYIVAIDAIKFKEGDPVQFEEEAINRQILKAYAGFSSMPQEARVVTGGWGCGVFHGDLRTKLLIQWIAASLAGRQIVFCPFGKRTMLAYGYPSYLESEPVKKVYRMLLSAARQKAVSKGHSPDIFILLSEELQRTTV